MWVIDCKGNWQFRADEVRPFHVEHVQATPEVKTALIREQLLQLASLAWKMSPEEASLRCSVPVDYVRACWAILGAL
jgi:hypothetical protein